MKLSAVLTEAGKTVTHATLAAWEDQAKKVGYKVTKDNKSGTYHAWDGTTHKGSFKAGSAAGTLTEHIIKHGSGYRLVSKKSGKNLGDFPTKAAAEKHEREVEYFKHKNESVEEGADPQDAKSKWTVTYDTYGSNKDVPLKKGATKIVYADTADAACAEVKKLVGGRDHKAECVRKPL